MKLRFNPQDDERRYGHRAPPPDYFSRRVQLRMLTLVGSLMLVLVLMFEAGKPENWRWMWRGQQLAGGPPLTPQERANKQVDTRLRRMDQPPTGDADVTLSDSSPHQPTAIVPREDGPLYRAQFDGWSTIWNGLNVDQRSLLQDGLRLALLDSPWPDRDDQAWQDLVQSLDRRWQAYLDESFLAMAQDRGELTEEAKRLWLSVLDQLRDQWQQQIKPALESLTTEDGVTDRQPLVRLRQLLDEVTLNQVRDNTVWRAAERDAWYRLLERLQTSSLAQLERESVGYRGFLQLYDQPQAYRGKLVKVRGVARLAYFEPARDNSLGIPGYYVFWIRPAGGPRLPIVVYCLELPEGFPPVRPRDADQQRNEMDVDVEFTGFFFKRWAYLAKDGIDTAPLVVAKIPRWDGGHTSVSSAGTLPSIVVIVAGISLSALLALTITALVYYQTRRPTPMEQLRVKRQESSARSLDALSLGSPWLDAPSNDAPIVDTSSLDARLPGGSSPPQPPIRQHKGYDA